VTFLGWRVARGLDTTVSYASRWLSFTLLVPVLYAYREPRYGVLWGGRSCDVQAGAREDVARQATLNRLARERRQLILVTLKLRDELTPTFERLAESFAALSAVGQTARQATAEFGAAYQRTAGRGR
jgi:hypothetical protein